MMNVTRREPFILDIDFDCGVEELKDFHLSLCQGGRAVLTKQMREAVIDDTGRRASFTLTGEETARLNPFDPAYVQIRAVLLSGEELHSAAHEVNAVDVLNAREERLWASD